MHVGDVVGQRPGRAGVVDEALPAVAIDLTTRRLVSTSGSFCFGRLFGSAGSGWISSTTAPSRARCAARPSCCAPARRSGPPGISTVMFLLRTMRVSTRTLPKRPGQRARQVAVPEESARGASPPRPRRRCVPSANEARARHRAACRRWRRMRAPHAPGSSAPRGRHFECQRLQAAVDPLEFGEAGDQPGLHAGRPAIEAHRAVAGQSRRSRWCWSARPRSTSTGS